MEYATKLDERMKKSEDANDGETLHRLAWLEQDPTESNEELLTPLNHLVVKDDDDDYDTGDFSNLNPVKPLLDGDLEIVEESRLISLGLKGGEEKDGGSIAAAWEDPSFKETSPLFDNFKMSHGNENQQYLNGNGNLNGNAGKGGSLNGSSSRQKHFDLPQSTLVTSIVEEKELHLQGGNIFTNDTKHTPLLSHSTNTTSPPPNESTSSRGVANRWNLFISHNYKLILITATLLFLSGIYSLPTFLSMTDSTPHPTDGSPSQHALDTFRNAYGGGPGIGLRPDDGLNPGIVLIWNQTNYTDHTPTLAHSKPMREFTHGLQLYLEENLPHVDQHATPPPGSKRHSHLTWIDPVINVTSYYSLHYDEQLTQSAKVLMTPDGRSTVMYVSFSIPTLAYAKKRGQSTSPHNVLRTYSSSILKSILEYCEVLEQDTNHDLIMEKRSPSHSLVPPNVSFAYTGILPFQEDMRLNLSQDLHRMHAYVLPLSLFILSIVLDGHFGLIVITVLSVGCVVAASSWVMMYTIWSGWIVGVSQFTPNVMICLSFGLGIDYT